MLLYEPDSGFFAMPHAATGLADKVIIIASHMAASLAAKDANLAITVVVAYFTSVCNSPALHGQSAYLNPPLGTIQTRVRQ